MTVETYLLRGKRRVLQWMEIPWVRLAGKGMLFWSAGLVLSAASFWGRMQPLAVGLAAAGPGWWKVFAAAGSAVGYRLFWGEAGLQGAAWSLGALALGGLLPFFGDTRKESLAVGCACLVSAAGLFFQFRFADPTPAHFFLLRIGLAGASAALAENILRGRDRVSQWIAAGLTVLACSRLPGNPGFLAAGALTAAVPLPGAALAGLGADIGCQPAVPMTSVAVLSFFLQLLPLRESRRRLIAPGAACLILMVLYGRWELPQLFGVALGGILGALIPWHITALPRHGSLGAAQVQLEQNARVLLLCQRQLLEYAPPPPDAAGVLEQLRQNACGSCTARHSCRERERLEESILTGTGSFPCRKAGLLGAELRRSRDLLKRIRLDQARREECRRALAGQYGFLAEVLQQLADRLPEREYRPPARFRVHISARSRGKEFAEGDRVLAFPGLYCRYYVVLCDGMGTGLGAAEEGRQASGLLRQMLTAGLSPSSALNSINSQLTLLGKGGAVTVDLAELRLDSGTAWIYKWGAGPSWLIHRGKAEKIGLAMPPPGLEIGQPGEFSQRAAMDREQLLVMVSDGVSGGNADAWARESLPLGELAARILADAAQNDDATAVVIRLSDLKKEPVGE